ncbi:MAG: hypothetical protein BWY70_00825 [Bacteroidetes bacterium ADurb.Bin408]|nr:MAG: hypothetical protein BWY70_00825 [Bacteroidetes bacterium ADurb.Bin408]
MNILRNKIFKHYKLILLIFIGIVFIKIAFNTNKYGIYNWQSAYWADASGYYIYLPATFIHGFYAENYPDDIDAKFGYGFTIDKEKNKLFTKYPMGIAMMTFPFFLIFHLLAFILGFKPDGFSEIYYYMPSITTPFYLLTGLLFLYKFLRNYVNKTEVFLSLLAILLGTNLFYYAFIASFMTHTYSFALFSFFLFALKKYIISNYTSRKYLIFLSLCTGLIFLTRPTNLIILLIIPFLDINSFSSFTQRIKNLVTLKKILLFTVGFLVIILPQLLYWKFVSGSFLYFNPKIVEVLFAPLNGMFLYNPIILLLFIFLITGVIRKEKNSILLFSVTLISLYIISSWGCFFYGCSFGCRPFVEYLALLALPFAQFLQNRKKTIKSITLLACIYLIYFNLSLINNVFAESRCFLGDLGNNSEYVTGKNTKVRLWNWREYKILLEKAKIFPFKSHHYTWKNNFDPDFNDYFFNKNENTIKRQDAPSGQFVTTTQKEYSDGFYYVKADKISKFYVNHIKVSAYINQLEVDSNAYLVCQISLNDSTYFWSGKKIVELSDKTSEWVLINTSFDLPFIDFGAKYNIYFWSPQKKNILIDDMKIVFKY